MNNLEIAQRRLKNQRISGAKFKKPAEIVKYMGAMQAQDYAGAKWAVGLRLQNTSDAAIDKALANGSIIRTHVLRPTWHFISPDDARWMIELTADRINAAAATQYRQFQLNNAIFKQSNDALAKALAGGKHFNRAEMMTILQRAGIATNDLRFIHLLMHAELDKVICSGPRQGKQFTYAFFDDKVPPREPVKKEEALAKLTMTYFTSRGPATLQDLKWWSGLSAPDARLGLEIVKNELRSCIIDNKEYWQLKHEPEIGGRAPVAHLLPAFDEFAVAYHDRTAVVDPLYLKQAGYVISSPVIVVNSRVAGTWKRSIKKDTIAIELNTFGKLNNAQAKAVATAADRYRRFVNP